MAMRDFAWSRTLGINLFLTGVTEADISIAAIAARAESPATLSGATLTAPDVLLEIPAGLRGGGGHSDYLECEDTANHSTSRSFDADGHSLNILISSEPATRPSPNELSVEFTSKARSNSQPRLEVTVMERSENTLGPFPAS